MKFIIGGYGYSGYSIETENLYAKTFYGGISNGWEYAVNCCGYRIIKYMNDEMKNKFLLRCYKDNIDLVTKEYIQSYIEKELKNRFENNGETDINKITKYIKKEKKDMCNNWITEIGEKILFEKLNKANDIFCNEIDNIFEKSLGFKV